MPVLELLCEKLFWGKPHNRLIHFPKPDKESAALNQTVGSVLNPHADVFGGPEGSNCVVPPQGGNEENKSFVATSFLKNKTRTVLLSSVQCYLRDKFGLLHEVRALLDVGSQSNFITKDCADRLQLKNEKINLLVSCLNNESTMRINEGITTSRCNDDLSFKKELNLLVVKKITDLTSSQIINVSLNKPSEIKLADYKFNIPVKIDMLLGAEIFYELLRPGQIYCGDSRLLLQNTVFGYVVSGSVGDEVTDNKIHCGLIRDSDLNTTLKSFRELKSIGVKNENCNSEEDVSLGVFKQRVHFKNDRYEVELPWKRDRVELSDNFNLEKRQFGSPMRKMQSDKVLYSEYSFDASACERRVLKEEMGSEKSNEDMELPQATERVIPLESKRAKMLSVGPDAMAHPVTVPEEKCLPRALLISVDEMCEEKEERSVDVIKETVKEDINPVVLNRKSLNLNNDEIEEIKQKVWFKPNLKTSSYVIFVHHHWRKYSQVQRGVGKPTRKLPFIQRSVVMRKRSTMREKVRLKSRRSDIDSQKYRKSVSNGEQPFMEICVQEKSAKEKPPLIRSPSLDGCEVKSDLKMENDRGP
ncbi:DUF1758 domain-containing protein [Trichonephila clavipes]|nr:DUF1758 domain-containing protein [Trichonephila clavipes]